MASTYCRVPQGNWHGPPDYLDEALDRVKYTTFVDYYACVCLIIGAVSAVASLLVIRKLRSKGQKPLIDAALGPQSMKRFMDGVVLLMAGIDLMFVTLMMVCVVVTWRLWYFNGPINHWIWWMFAQVCWLPQFYHCYIASVCYNWVVRGHSVPRLRRGFRPALRLMVVAVAVQGSVQMALNGLHEYYDTAPNIAGCHWSQAAYGLYLGVHIAVQTFLASCHLRTCWSLYIRRVRCGQRLNRAYRKIVWRLVQMCLMSFVVWSFWTAIMVMWYTAFDTKKTVMMVLSIPVWLYPAFDAVMLGKVFSRPKGDQRDGLARRRRPVTIASTSVKHFESRVPSPETVAFNSSGSPPAFLFVTTYNAGGVRDIKDISGEIDGWVPQGYDVYCIGLQECQVVDDLRQLIHAHLGGPSVYRMFHAEVAQANVLYGSIALTVFAKTSDVETGAFRAMEGLTTRVRNGVDLVVLKAANKGVAGMAFRYHDVTFAVLTAHLASDSGGKQRLHQRNEGAARALRGLCLMDEEGFDLQLEHHHTIVLGDLNYRMRLDAHDMVERMTKAARVCKHTMDRWHKQRSLCTQGPAICPSVAVEIKDTESYVNHDTRTHTPTHTPAHTHAHTHTSVSECGGGVSWVRDGYLRLFRRSQEPVVEGLRQRWSSSQPSQVRSIISRPMSKEEEEDDDEYLDDDDVDDIEVGSASGRRGQALRRARGWLTRWLPHRTRTHTHTHTPADTHTHAHSETSSMSDTGDNGVFTSGPSAVEGSSDYVSNDTLPYEDTHAHTTHRTHTDALAKAWAWVAEHDELQCEMRAGSVFAGFLEGPIAFPPSFRLRPGLDPGDYTLMESIIASYVLHKKGDGQRTPSYTDRIIFHSLPDMRGDLQLLAYQMCDAVVGSDHRPIAAAFSVNVNRQVVGFRKLTKHRNSDPALMQHQNEQVHRPITDESASSVRGAEQTHLEDAKSFTTSVWSLRLRHVTFTARKGAKKREPQPNWQVQLQFPCQLEDPLAPERKAADLQEAVEGHMPNSPKENIRQSSLGTSRWMWRNNSVAVPREDSGDIPKLEPPGLTEHMSALVRAHHAPWSAAAGCAGMTIKVAVVPEVSRHALIRVIDDRGQEVGQGVICLRHAFTTAPSSSAGTGSSTTLVLDAVREPSSLLRTASSIPPRLASLGQASVSRLFGQKSEAPEPAPTHTRTHPHAHTHTSAHTHTPKRVEVQLSSAGRAVGRLTMEISIHRRAYSSDEEVRTLGGLQAEQGSHGKGPPRESSLDRGQEALPV